MIELNVMIKMMTLINIMKTKIMLTELVFVGGKWITNRWVIIHQGLTSFISIMNHDDQNIKFQVNYLEQWKQWPCQAEKNKIGWQERFKPFSAHY